MKINLIPEEGKFYKANMHCHTTVSDGKQTPEEIKELFKSLGYSAVAYTDHCVMVPHEDLCDDEFIALHGYEFDVTQMREDRNFSLSKVYHINLIAKNQSERKMPYVKESKSNPGKPTAHFGVEVECHEMFAEAKYDLEWINAYLEKVTSRGFLANYNHPQWSLQNATDYLGIKNVHSVELINGGCLGQNDNTAIHYETFLRDGLRVVPTAGDDNHHAIGCGRCWTMIKAKELTYDALIEAYEKGYCYASDGPEIHSIDIEDGKINIKCSEASEISLHAEGRYVDYCRSKTETFTEAHFNFNFEKMGSFFRIEVRDKAGFKAFSNAYYIDDILKNLN